MLPGDPEWDDARRAWNLAVDQRPVAIALVSPRGQVLQANRELRERTGHVQPEGLLFWDFVPEEDRNPLAASWPPDSENPEAERRYVRADGSIGWIHWTHSLLLPSDSSGSSDMGVA